MSRILFAVVVVVFAWLLLARRLQTSALTWTVMIALCALYFVLPFQAKQGAWINSRAIILISFLLFALTEPVRLRRAQHTILLGVLAACFLVRMAVVTETWAASADDVQAVRDVLTSVPPGSRLLPIGIDPFGHRPLVGPRSRRIGTAVPPSWSSYGAFAVIDRDDYWPGMFAYPGQQPMVNRPPFDRLADVPGQAALEIQMLAPDYKGPVPDGLSGILSTWNQSFDYLLVLTSDVEPDLPPSLQARLQRLRHQGFATLYKINAP